MITQVIIITVFAIIGLIILRTEHQARKIKILVIIAIGFLLYFSIVTLFTSEEVDISSPRGVVQATYLYFGWIGRSVSNLWDIGVDTTHLIGNAIKINNTKTPETQR
ncbi:MAG: hypothetical protein V1889_00105 [archaeon]